MHIKKVLFFLCFTLLSTQTFAIKSYYAYEGRTPFVITLNIGPAWARPGETQTLSLQPDVIKTYVPYPMSSNIRFISSAKGSRSLINGELFVGFAGLINSVVMGQLGVAIGGNSSVKLQGTIWDDANLLLNNYAYSYSVANKRIALKAKALYDINTMDLFPYVTASVGAGMTNSSGFTIKPLLITEVPPPVFGDRNSSGLYYSLGLGLEAALDDGWRVGLGYEFADWGQSSLNAATGQFLGRGLRLKSLRTHELLLSLSYLC